MMMMKKRREVIDEYHEKKVNKFMQLADLIYSIIAKNFYSGI